MTSALLYVSRSLLTFPEGDDAVADIIKVSEARNAALDVTGALISTPSYFAQYLEGPPAAIHELMRSIGRDRRHKDVTIVTETANARRRFKKWSMAYSGYASYIDAQIAPLFKTQDAARKLALAAKLVSLMQEFTR